MTGQQLKNSILQEAIQGRLVPQDPSHRPASELLAAIYKEKFELVKAGKIKKKDMEIEPISSDEIPFEKPRGWEFVRLSDISLDSADGPFGSNLKKEHYTIKKEVRIIQLSNIGELGWRDSNVKYTTFNHLENVSRSEAFAGDIIIAKMMPAGRAIICPNVDIKYVLSSDAVRFDFSSHLNKRYLYYAINSPAFRDQVYGEVQGITRVRTSLNKLRTYILPIPPLSEQQLIVEKIEKLLPLVDEYDKAAGELKVLNESLPDKLRKSVLQEAIHGTLVPNDIPEGEATAQDLLQQILEERQDRENKEKGKKAKKLTLSTIEEEPWELPEGWCWCCLGDLFSITSGDNLTTSNMIPGPYPVYGGNGITGYHNNYNLNKRSIIIGRVGAKCGSIHIVNGNVWITDNAFIMSIYDPKTIDLDFLALMLKHMNLGQYSKSTAQPVISGQSIYPVCFPLPPLSIQHRIVEKIEELFSAISQL